MGKTRRQRKRPKYKNPTGLLSVKDTQQEEGEHSAGDQISKHEIAISAVLDQLQSPDVEHKVFGLQTLATMFTEPRAVQEVVRHEAVRVAAPLLLDASASVRNVAAGALRNLSASGGHEVCPLLVEQDVMTPLSALVQEYAVDWQPLKNSKVTDKKADTFLQAVHLLWNLCESSGTAVKYFNDRNMLPVLARCLDSALFGLDMVIAAAQCIQTVTEDNSTAVSQLQGSEPILRQLLMLEGDEPAVLLVRTLAAGLLVNLHYGQVSALAPELLAQLMATLGTALDPDHRAALSQLASSLLSAQQEERESIAVPAGVLLDAQQAAIELLTNLCSSDGLSIAPLWHHLLILHLFLAPN